MLSPTEFENLYKTIKNSSSMPVWFATNYKTIVSKNITIQDWNRLYDYLKILATGNQTVLKTLDYLSEQTMSVISEVLLEISNRMAADRAIQSQIYLMSERQNGFEEALSHLRNSFLGYVDSQEELSVDAKAGEFYITNSILALVYPDVTVGVPKNAIILASKDAPDKNIRDDWIIIKSDSVNDIESLKTSLQNHITDYENPHRVSLTQANGEVVDDSTFQALLEDLN